MPKLYPEALLFCILWSALAVAGFILSGWGLGALLSAGLFMLIMPASAFTLSRTGNFALERGIRWGILALGALLLFSVVDLAR
jgi:hypothetical protein